MFNIRRGRFGAWFCQGDYIVVTGIEQRENIAFQCQFIYTFSKRAKQNLHHRAVKFDSDILLTLGLEETGNRECRRLHNEEFNDLYCSPNIIRVIKSRRMIWAGHVARVEEREVHARVG